MRSALLFIFLAIAGAVCAQDKPARPVAPASSPAQVLPAGTSVPVEGYRLEWQDEFNGKKLDLTKWKYRGLGKRGDAFNTALAVRLDGKGHLIISARSERDTVFTGMIATEGLFETRYGYFECRARLPTSKGIWTAFWLQSGSNRDNGTPATNGAELDIFEYFPNLDPGAVTHTLHWGGYGRTHRVSGPVRAPLKSTQDGYHVFGFEWTPNSYTTFVDGSVTYTGNALISKVPEFMILSLEVSRQVAGPLKLEELPQEFIVDYVRVYKKL